MPDAEISQKSTVSVSDYPHIDQLNTDAFYARYGNLERLKVLAQMAVDQSRKAGYIKGIVESQNNLAYSFFRNSEYIDASVLAQETLTLARDNWLTAQEADTYFILGSIRRKMGDNTTAFEQLSEAISLAEQTGGDQVILACLNGIAIIYINLGEPESAIDYFQRSLLYNTDPAIAEQNRAVCLNNCCQPYCDMGNYQMALECALESREIFRKLEDSFNESFALMNLGYVKRISGDYEGSLQHYAEALEIALIYGETYNLTSLIIGLSETYLDMGRIAEAIERSEEAIIQANLNGSVLLIAPAYRTASRAYAKAGQHKQAYGYLENYLAAQEEFQKQDTNGRLKAMQQMHEIESTRREAELHRLRSNSLEKQIKDIEQVALVRSEQERLILALAQEHELSQAKSRLIDHVSLKIRTPLTIIQSSAALLQEYHGRMSQEKMLGHIEAMNTEIGRTIMFVDEIIEMGRKADAPSDVSRRNTNLRELCMQVVEEVARLPQERGRVNIKVAKNAQQEMINPLLVSRGLAAILANALQYSAAPAQVAIKVSRVHSELIIRVQDRGIGIKPEDIPAVTRPMYRGDNIGDIAGAGLGLTIAQNCIVAHHGTLEIESAPEGGTTVTMRLPVPA